MEAAIAAVLVLVTWLLLSWAISRYADSKGLDGAGYFVLSIFLSPLIALAFAASARVNPGGLGLCKCPDCAEWVQPDAKKCRFCGRGLIAHESRAMPPRAAPALGVQQPTSISAKRAILTVAALVVLCGIVVILTLHR